MSNTIDEAVSPSEQDSKIAMESSLQLTRFAANGRVQLHLTDPGHANESIELPRPVIGMLLRILKEMAAGNGVTLIPINAELTTQRAASMIGVSRPFLIQQMKQGKIPFRLIGTHRRVRFQDLMDYKRRIDADRVKVLEQLAAQAQELNMGY